MPCHSCTAQVIRDVILGDTQLAEFDVPPRRPVKTEPLEQTLESAPELLTMKLILRFYLPLDERTLDRWLSTGRFPKADISMGGKVRLWKRETVKAWIERQCDES